MGYVYDSVVAVLGGKSLVNPTKEGSLVQNWSPNMFRRVAILTDGVLVEYHGFDHRVKSMPFDMIKVSEDLASGSKYKNPLRPLFEYKALSCLEEVFISEALVTDQMVKTYLSTLVATHRLRAISLVPANVNVKFLESAIAQFNSGSTALDCVIGSQISGSKTKETDISDFHKRHYLRPTLYKLDVEGGNLSKYFAKVEQIVESNKSKKQLQSRLEELVSNDKKEMSFWTPILKLLILTRKSDVELKKSLVSFTKELTNSVMSSGGRYSEELKEYYSKQNNSNDSLFVAYRQLGYFKEGAPFQIKDTTKGFLPVPEYIAKRMQEPIKALFRANEYDSLSLVKVSKEASEKEILLQVVKSLIAELEGKVFVPVNTPVEGSEAEEESSIKDELKERILSQLPEELMSSIFNLWHDLQEEYKQSATITLSAKGTGFPYRFSESKIQKLGLPRHAETLALLGYCGGDDELSHLSELSFSEELNSLCRQATKTNFSELLSKSWERLSDVEKCDYIIRRLG